ncbi:MAG: SAM-dependent methyltransferase [Ottowia sp.]
MMRPTGFKTRVQQIHIPQAGDFLIRSLLDRQQYHDPAGRAARVGISSALWPLFGLLWPSAIHLASHLALRPVNPLERILEIGCGLALASLVAHKRGACVTASDRHPLVPLFLHENLNLNRLPPRLRYRHGQWGLDSPPTRAQVGCTVLCGRYDLIAGSDLLYQRDAPPAVAAFINRHARPRSEVWIVDADRGYRPAFNRCMAAHGFKLQEQIRLREADRPDRPGHAPRYKGRLLKYRRNRLS